MKTIIYIDGFNLYYRLKRTPYKWLNLQKLSKFYLSSEEHQILKIKYFTAQVKRKSGNTSNILRRNIYLRAIRTLLDLLIRIFRKKIKRIPSDTSNIIRQNMYLRAVQTLPDLEIIFGQFKRRKVTGLKCHYKNGKYIEGTKLVTISKWEEKESDVNIATHLVADASQYDCAVLISNDTDLKTPLKYVKENFKKRIGIISPRRNIHTDLKDVSHFQKRITNKALKQCQFPEKMEDDKGEFFCPPKWKQNS